MGGNYLRPAIAGLFLLWQFSRGLLFAAEPKIIFRVVTSQTGISFCHTDGSTGRRHIVETVASGLATFDYDGDGLIDVYFLNGAPLDEPHPSVPPRNALYRNLGGLRFAEVTEKAAVGDTGYGLGVAVGDFDNDGFPDVYISNYGANVFYRNNGDGTFSNVTAQTGTACDHLEKAGAGTSFLDCDGDGDLDLYVANYLAFSPRMGVTNSWRGIPIYPDPSRFRHWPDQLFRNNGDGTFSDISKEAGVDRHEGRGMGMVCADFDNDGDTDVFVASDGPPGNSLLINDGSGRFEDIAMLAGVAFDSAGLAHGAMGADCGDYDNDGWLDLYVTSYQGQWATLYRNLGGGLFEDVTQATGAGAGSLNHVTWGCSFVDFDNDGDRDIFFGCGHLIDNIELLDDSTSLEAPPVLLVNTGRGTFVNASASAGELTQVRAVARGVAFDDLDNDGRIDVVILSSRRPPVVLLNQTVPRNHWVHLYLQGTSANREGVSARVKVVTGKTVQIAEVHSGRGYQSHYGTRLHFGLGQAPAIDRIEVRWIGGGVDVWENLPVNRQLILREGCPDWLEIGSVW